MKLQRYTCRTVRNMLPLHVGGDLDPRHGPEVDLHLNDCLVCFREFRELGAMRSRLAVLAEQPLPSGILDGFAEEVMARIDVGEPGPAAEAPSPGPRQRIFSFQRLSAAAAILLVSLAGWRALTDQGLVGDGSIGLDRPGLAESVSDGWPTQQQLPRAAITAAPLTAKGTGQTQTQAQALNDFLETAWPLGVPAPTEVQIILRSRGGVPTVTLHGQASKASGLERDEAREPRQRKP